MWRKRSPDEDKQLDYRRQTRGFAEYHHSMRHGKWRKSKRRPAQGAERAASRDALARVDGANIGFDPGVIRRPRIAKWGASPLREWVASRMVRRIRTGSLVLPTRAYDGGEDRQRFAAQLRAVVGRGRPTWQRDVGPLEAMIADLDGAAEPSTDPAALRWLRAFFADEPALEGQLRRWLADEEIK